MNLDHKTDEVKNLKRSKSQAKPALRNKRRELNSPVKIEYEEEIDRKLPQTTDYNMKLNFPAQWEKMYQNILSMRIKRDAAVDLMGAEKCQDLDTSPEVKRYQTLISLMLSSQTKDSVTHAAVMKLRDHGLTISNVLKTPIEEIQRLIYPVGFYKRKADYILRSTKILEEKFGGDIPNTVKDLCTLPGVGKKMAYLCVDIAWQRNEGIGVDTHVHRIANRLGWTGENGTTTPEGTRKALENWLPREKWREINVLLVGFGQQICLPVYPKCSSCLNQFFCPFFKNAPQTNSPRKRK